MLKLFVIMSPIFAIALVGWGLTQTNQPALQILGYVIIGLIFATGLFFLVFLQTPSTNRIHRKTWNDFSLSEKIKWKFKNGLRRN